MLHDVRAVTVCVNYDDFLAVTLLRTIQHVASLTVVTSTTDHRTIELCQRYPKSVQLITTDVFYANGASFNKGAALEHAFDVMGRTGWFVIMDADILLPVRLPSTVKQPGKLYTPRRRILSDVAGLTADTPIDVVNLPVRQESGHFGYFQLFHATDPAINRLPWYETNWVHAGGCDSVFEKRWIPRNKLRPSFDVVHLGDPDANWYGRTRPRIDNGEVPSDAADREAKQQALHRKYGWKGFARTNEPAEEKIGSDPAKHEVCHIQGKRRIVGLHRLPVRRLP